MKQSQITANRYHDISVGHRVVGHEGKCRFLHGHNYRIHFEVVADDATDPLDDVGRVLDFGVIKSHLCMWLEDNWDHKFLAWEEDQLVNRMYAILLDSGDSDHRDVGYFQNSVVFVPFNPTAENMAQHLVEVVAPVQLQGTGCTLIKAVVEETRKCSCTYTKGD